MNNEITDSRLQKTKAPFTVQAIGKRGKPLKRIITIEGFSEDPLGVGVPVVFFKGGGWLDIHNFMRNYVFSEDNS